MVTWTFDLVALLIGFMLGVLVGGLVSLWITIRLDDEENGMNEWNNGYRKGTETMEKIYMKGKEDKKNEIKTEISKEIFK